MRTPFVTPIFPGHLDWPVPPMQVAKRAGYPVSVLPHYTTGPGIAPRLSP